jgi:hypothetical protein
MTFDKELERARKKGVPQGELDNVTYGDFVALAVVVDAWMRSPERLEQINKKRRTPQHNQLLKFIDWAIKNDHLHWTIDLRQTHTKISRGDKIGYFEWLVDVTNAYIKAGKYKPQGGNLKRSKAPWRTS